MLRLGGWLASCIFSVKTILSVILRSLLKVQRLSSLPCVQSRTWNTTIGHLKLVLLLRLDSFSPDDVRGAEPGRFQTSFSAVRGDPPSLLEDSMVKAMANAMDGVVHNG